MPYLLAIPHYSWFFSHASYSSRASSRSRNSSYSRVQFSSLLNITPPIFKIEKGSCHENNFSFLNSSQYLKTSSTLLCAVAIGHLSQSNGRFFRQQMLQEVLKRFIASYRQVLSSWSCTPISRNISTYFSLLSKEAAHAAILFSGMGKWNTQNGRTKSSMFVASASSCSMPLIG